MQIGTSGSVVGFLNEIAGRFPAAVFLAAGAPAKEFLARLDMPMIQSAVQSFMHDASLRAHLGGTFTDLMQYGPTSGLIGEILARHLAVDHGLTVAAEQVLVTAGCQEALALCLPEICRQTTDCMLVCNPTYIGATGAALAHHIPVFGLSLHKGNLARQVLDNAEAARRRGQRVRVLYLMPTFDNPSGLVLNLDERAAILQVCAREGIIILEDNAYGAYAYDGSSHSTMAQQDPGGCVIYLSTFSKTLAPSLRVGAATLPAALFGDRRASRDLMARLIKRKGMITLNTSQINQAIVGGILLERDCSLREWIAPARDIYQANRDALLDQLQTDFAGFGNDVHWTRPGGGFFVSLTLPLTFGLDEALHCARVHDVIAMPMRFFSLDDSADHSVRLAFSSITPERARSGVSGLAAYVEAHLAQAGAEPVNHTSAVQ